MPAPLQTRPAGVLLETASPLFQAARHPVPRPVFSSAPCRRLPAAPLRQLLLICPHCSDVYYIGVCLQDRKSTRLNSSHVSISYAVFCLKKKTTPITE